MLDTYVAKLAIALLRFSLSVCVCVCLRACVWKLLRELADVYTELSSANSFSKETEVASRHERARTHTEKDDDDTCRIVAPFPLSSR